MVSLVNHANKRPLTKTLKHVSLKNVDTL